VPSGRLAEKDVIQPPTQGEEEVVPLFICVCVNSIFLTYLMQTLFIYVLILSLPVLQQEQQQQQQQQ
jgi:hypothetical protein